MRVLSRLSRLPLVLALAGLPLAALADDLIPAKRFALTNGVDRPGDDIATLFDTTLEACQNACTANAACTDFTFNTAKGACFVKAAPDADTAFETALSGHLLTRAADAEALALTRRADLPFLYDWDIAAATEQARTLGTRFQNDGVAYEDRRAAAAQAEAEGDTYSAFAHMADAANLSDSAADWAEFARLSNATAAIDQNDPRSYRDRAFAAATNAYLRAATPADRGAALTEMAYALEGLDRGSEAVKALRLAQSVAPDDATAALLSDFAGKYGFRVTENRVESESARPRLCATFSEDLAGIDYTPFVRAADPTQTVTVSGRDLCLGGVTHGQRVTLTLREGLPAADGQTLPKSVEIASYIRDRSPAVRFPGRAYVLPKSGDPALPVETVNTTALDLTLYRVTDRNLIRAVQNGYLSAPLADWQEYDFTAQTGTEVWHGTATVGNELNRDMTTRLPMAEALAAQPSGVFALRAAVPDADPYKSPAGWQFFTVSDLGLTTLSGTDGLHVFVLSLGSAKPLQGVTLQLLSTANEVLGEAATDASGHAVFDAGLTRGTGSAAPGMVVARNGDSDLAFLSLTDPEFDLSDRGVEGREASPPVDLFLATDRGAYRAGETVNLTALARDGDARAITGLPLTAVLLRPDGVEYSRALATDTAGGYVLSLPVAESAPRGVWRVDMLADLDAPPLASKTFLVEDFLPERIDFTLGLPERLSLGAQPDLTVEARYLFGAAGADLAIEGETMIRAAAELDGWQGYRFGREDEPFSALVQPVDPARTDASGKATLSLPLPAVATPDRPLEARVTLRLAEGSGRPVERSIVRPVAPAAPLIGIKPLFDGVVAENAKARFSLVGVGTDGKATPLSVKWVLTRVETEYQWYQSYGAWNWEPVTTRSRIAEGEAALNGPTEIAAAVQWGEYELAVERADGTPAASSVTFSAGWYAPADVSSTPDTLDLSLDKAAYSAGDTATLRLVPRFAGTALVTVLSNRVIAMQAVTVTEGENTIKLPVTDDWGAGVYVTASVLRPMDVAAGRNPARALGLAHAAIAPGTRALTATILAPPEAAPRAPLDVSVRVDGIAAGETAYVTLAAVDQGILNLTGYTPPDPQGYYFGQRKLGVGIRDLYGRLIDGLNGAAGTVRSGGDAGAQARLQSPPPTEDLLAFFSGPIPVGPDGMARASFDLPAFNGSVKLMAVAWSASAIGQASADTLVRDPVVVTASLPRFLAPDDQSRLLLEIVHATGPAGEMPLSVTADGLTLGPVPASVTLTKGGKQTLSIPVTATETGLHSIAVTLTTPDGKPLTRTLTLPVEVQTPEITRLSRFDLKQGQSFTFDATVLDGLSNARATLAAGPIARLNAPATLAALDRYPYGCTEQLTSRALPLLYLDPVAQALGLPHGDDLAPRLAATIRQILTNQGAEGGFGLWQPGSGDFWLDAFVTDFLSRAKARGYDVPDQAFRLALDNLRNRVNYAADFDTGGEALAYALYVLAREGAANIGDLRYYADTKADAFATPAALAQLGAALAAYGDQPRADALFARAESALAPDTAEQVWRIDYGSPYRDAAALLALATESGSTAINRESVADRIAAHEGPLSTQEATWSLLAASALSGDTPALSLNGEATSGPLVRLLDTSAPLTVRNDGADTTLTVSATGTPLSPEPAGGNGYAITRSYYTLDGQPFTGTTVKAGTRLVAVIEVTPFANGQARLMVADPLPAGFEIDNPNLLTGGAVTETLGLDLLTETAHSEFRQDRFLSAIDRSDNQPFRLGYIVRAVTPGSYVHPAASVEDMYQPDFRAHTDTGRMTVTE
ncbi:alpha-2-macroglobulin family protein [Paragemmobacter straminiformis]|uniref:Alpha-2-macroglobulin family protein n=1 Tax=Paragemmobacter straminiformis TaxID=2045119 RepID=A0A842IAY3_9RHOB|nr:alpha-2-macroglobulin family protein [Gemmobacter straminiformis]MBC2836264.1 alpha-2-macroglobulin family protein [Gemmobacter straminiformis]